MSLYDVLSALFSLDEFVICHMTCDMLINLDAVSSGMHSLCKSANVWRALIRRDWTPLHAALRENNDGSSLKRAYCSASNNGGALCIAETIKGLRSLKWSPDGKAVAAMVDYCVEVFPLASYPSVKYLPTDLVNHPVEFVWSPNSTHLSIITVGSSSEIDLWNALSGELIRRIDCMHSFAFL